MTALDHGTAFSGGRNCVPYNPNPYVYRGWRAPVSTKTTKTTTTKYDKQGKIIEVVEVTETTTTNDNWAYPTVTYSTGSTFAGTVQGSHEIAPKVN